MANSTTTTSFVNIDLDESQIKEEEEEKKNEEEEGEEGGKDNDESSRSEKTTPKAFEKRNAAELDRLGKQLVEDYAKYYRLNSGSQIDELNECIENLLTHMEEFYGLVEMIRAEGGACMDQLTTSSSSEDGSLQSPLESRRAQLQGLFRMIDKLERIVGHVGLHLSLMEREVARAEKAMGKRNAVVSRLFSLISSSQSSSSSSTSGGGLRGSTYVPPDIFKVEDLMKL